MLINTFFITLIIPFTLILLAYSRNRIYMRINVFISLFQFGVSYYFIKYYGIFGAGISTLIAYCTLLVIMIFVYFAEKSKGNLQTVISS
ncbi:MAG: polysaccharide biosynthesis C-terminal domain-containing protein [Saprospiraceae bacterium]|nr:polysaccharide biosynthesis C-terminal domain-containing protein [Candidatus Brachybacter algidus]